MKIEYLIHEYTWSNHCISGNKLGWGITASSVPEDRSYLRELEKLAQAAVVDRTGNIEVEELVYSSVCGFVKMSSIPCEAGEDKRQNKRVRMYQPKAPETNPATYLAPGKEWTEGESVGYLPPLLMEETEFCIQDILQEMELEERLPEFIQAVFWCLSGKSEGLNIVVPKWREEEFAHKTRKLMYVIHSFLPQSVRERAGYVSFTREAIPSVSFYFSKEACGTHTFVLSQDNGWEGNWDELDTYFYTGFADARQKKKTVCEVFEKEALNYLKNARRTGNILKKLEWIFYDILRKQSGAALSREYLIENIPELLYWVAKDKALSFVAEDILKEVQGFDFSQAERQSYVESLLRGITGRSREQIIAELDRVLSEIFEKDKAEFASLLAFIRDKNKDVYTSLLCGTFAVSSDSDYRKSMFRLNARDMESLYKYIQDFNEQSIPAEKKDDILRTGINLLNEKLFDKKRYGLFDKIAISLNRKEQWIMILEDFVRQLREHAHLFDKKQLDAACYIEQLLGAYRPEMRMVMRENHDQRIQEQKKNDNLNDAGEEV